jgi:hypothetical protein
MKPTTIHIGGIRVVVPVHPDQIPKDLGAPSDDPAGPSILDVILGGGAPIARAKIRAKNYHRLMGQIDKHGAAGVAVTLQGVLRPPPRPGEPFQLTEARFQGQVKTPRPPAPAEPTAPAAAEPTAPGPGRSASLAAQAPRGYPGGEPAG